MQSTIKSHEMSMYTKRTHRGKDGKPRTVKREEIIIIIKKKRNDKQSGPDTVKSSKVPSGRFRDEQLNFSGPLRTDQGWQQRHKRNKGRRTCRNRNGN